MKKYNILQTPNSHEHENNLFKEETKLLQDTIIRLIRSAKAKGYLNSAYLDQYAGFSIAINADWGVGKTTFLDMLTNYFQSEECELRPCIVIKYNAWENDGFEDPFASLYCEILCNEDAKLTVKLKQSGMAVWTAIKKKSPDLLLDSASIVANVVHPGLSIFTNPIFNYLKGVYNAITGKKNRQTDIIEQYKQYHLAIKKFKNDLGELKGNDFIKLIIIDELDRCNPIFAIKLLERIKHVFSAQNTVFLFAANLKQLAESVKKLYGQDTDSLHYLSRFFNHIVNFNQGYTSLYQANLSNNTTQKIGAVFADKIYSYFHFTTREIKKFIYEWHNTFDIIEELTESGQLTAESVIVKQKNLLIFLIALKTYDVISYGKLIDPSNLKKILILKAKELQDKNDRIYTADNKSFTLNRYINSVVSSFTNLLDCFCDCIGIDKCKEYFIDSNEISESLVLLFSSYYITGSMEPYNMQPGQNMHQVSNIETKLKVFPPHELIKLINFIDFGKVDNEE